GIELHQYLAGPHNRALVDEDLLDPERFLRGDVDELSLDAAVSGRDSFRQRRLRLLPVAEADERGHEGDRGHGNPFHSWLRDLAGHGDSTSACCSARLSRFPARAVATTCRPSRFGSSFRSASPPAPRAALPAAPSLHPELCRGR